MERKKVCYSKGLPAKIIRRDAKIQRGGRITRENERNAFVLIAT